MTCVSMDVASMLSSRNFDWQSKFLDFEWHRLLRRRMIRLVSVDKASIASMKVPLQRRAVVDFVPFYSFGFASLVRFTSINNFARWSIWFSQMYNIRCQFDVNYWLWHYSFRFGFQIKNDIRWCVLENLHVFSHWFADKLSVVSLSRHKSEIEFTAACRFVFIVFLFVVSSSTKTWFAIEKCEMKWKMRSHVFISFLNFAFSPQFLLLFLTSNRQQQIDRAIFRFRFHAINIQTSTQDKTWHRRNWRWSQRKHDKLMRKWCFRSTWCEMKWNQSKSEAMAMTTKKMKKIVICKL